jgi:hypothetical protein
VITPRGMPAKVRDARRHRQHTVVPSVFSAVKVNSIVKPAGASMVLPQSRLSP